jgi:simple sugar transport system ATP-binding protein
LAGIIRPAGGHIWLGQQKGSRIDLMARDYFYHKKVGISYMPAARLEEGLIPGLTLTSHFILAGEQKGVFINQSQALSLADRKIKDYNIKGSPMNTVESLSGGNQQRALLALLQNPLNLLLLEHPTRGLDIESTMYIWSKLKLRCEEGASILFISSDLDEVRHYSDRIIVFFGGRLSKAFDASKVTVEKLGELIGGKGWG